MSTSPKSIIPPRLSFTSDFFFRQVSSTGLFSLTLHRGTNCMHGAVFRVYVIYVVKHEHVDVNQKLSDQQKLMYAIESQVQAHFSPTTFFSLFLSHFPKN